MISQVFEPLILVDKLELSQVLNESETFDKLQISVLLGFPIRIYDIHIFGGDNLYEITRRYTQQFAIVYSYHRNPIQYMLLF